MAVWVNEKVEYYNNCLMIFNLGNDNIDSAPKTYKEMLLEQIALAHADGDVCLYVFDADTGPFRIPDEFTNIEGMDFVRMSFDVCNRRDLNFKLEPTKRREELKAISDHLKSHNTFRFTGIVKFCGKIKIDGTDVFMPLTDLNS